MSATAFQRMRREQEAKRLNELEEQPKKLEDMKVPELKEIAKEKIIKGYANMKRDELLMALLETEKPIGNEVVGQPQTPVEPKEPQNEEPQESKGAE